MRMSGKTTRKVDEAVQKLFTHREIIIPNVKCIKEYYGSELTGGLFYNKEHVLIIDEDWNSGHSQEFMTNSLVRRLYWEHNDQYIVNKKHFGTKILLK
jgi:hypothetical protein